MTMLTHYVSAYVFMFFYLLDTKICLCSLQTLKTNSDHLGVRNEVEKALRENIHEYRVHCDTEKGRMFDGIGAISGGGATSKLLRNYPVQERAQILDFLFKPGFGASLQILKVEIGGDAQSSAEGTEASHMHSEHDENYERGYEWWLMTEAKQRNPNIKLYGLPWNFPGWLGGGGYTPYYNKTNFVTYIVNWINGAKKYHNLDIDFIGVWNERPYDIEYIQMLKRGLHAAGYGHVKTVAGDAQSWQIVDDYINSTVLQQSLDIIGYHYPGTYSPVRAQKLPIPLWASEEYSAPNDLSGGGCWARVLNEGYVNGLFTANIAWNLIASYYADLPYPKSSLMTADQPWSGHYDVSSPIWMTAHHTQFTEIGWYYLAHGYGTGNLTGNGTYVAYTSPDKTQLTIVIETVDPSTSPCFYYMPKYTVSDSQTATFKLTGNYKGITSLNAWYSKFNFDGTASTLFEHVTPVKVVDNTLTVVLHKNEVITLTTVQSGEKGSYPTPPQPQTFPVPYHDDYENYNEHEEPYNLVQQAGVWEIVQSNDPTHGNVIRQTVPQRPVDTCRPDHMPHPIAVIGNFNWSDVQFHVDAYIEAEPQGADGVFVGARVSRGGCWSIYANGLYCWMYTNNTMRLTGNYSQSLLYKEVSFPVRRQTWYTIGLSVQNSTVTCSINSQPVISVSVKHMPYPNGFVAIGTTSFAGALFDNFVITNATINPHPLGPFPQR